MKIQLTNKTEVFNFGLPYIIAELGSNHNGDMELAKKLIKAAKESGADCVKFQSWSKNAIFSKKVYEQNYFLKDDYRARDDHTLESIVEKFSVSEQELLTLKNFCDDISIDFSSTPFSRKEVDYLVDVLKAPFVKIASMDLNNYPFLDYIARKERPIVLSTGLNDFSEIDRAVRVIERAGNDQIIILHCVSKYPPDDSDINLNNIETFMRMYPYPIGFSDHSIGFSIPLAATAKGASIIEKHFTIDKKLPGWDHKISANPTELKIICDESKRINEALGNFRVVCKEDAERKNAFKRSIVASRKIEKGEVFTEEMLDFKRPGSGIEPGDAAFVIGKIAKRDIDYDELIGMEDF